MRPILFVVNVTAEVAPTQTTAMLMQAALRRGHPTWVTDVTGLHFAADDRIVARARRLEAADSLAELCAQMSGKARARAQARPSDAVADAAAEAAAAQDPTEHRLVVEAPPEDEVVLVGEGAAPGLAVLLRTNPARDPRRHAHRYTLGLLRMARDRGVTVSNDPDGLGRAESKLYLCGFPAETRPETVISSEPAVLRRYVLGRSAPSILKPLEGTRGRDVFKIDPALGPGATTNLGALLDVLCRDGVAIAQAYVPEAAAGDTRVLMLNGAPLVVDGHLAAIRRVPKAGDHRSNLHTGGHAEPAALTPAMARACALMGPQLAADGIHLAGLDFIGEVVVEINVFSTGGLRDAERFTGQDFCAAIIAALVPEA